LKPFLYFTGGEPLLNHDVFEMISYANKEKFVTSLTSNGILLSERCVDVLDSGLMFLSVSVTGFEKEHDRIQGMEGAFDKTISGLTELLRERRGYFPRVKVNTLINRENYDRLYDLVAFLFDLGVDEMSLQHYSFYNDEIKLAQEECAKKFGLGRGVDGAKVESLPYLNSQQVERLKSELDKVVNSGFNVEIKPQVNRLTEYYLGARPTNNSTCDRISKEVIVRANGEIELCPGYVIGNIREGLKKSFYGEKAEVIRNYIANKGLLPACYRCCALNYDFENTC
jgi:MoaA/NifB/PqqE/SkfB family radical SAM enzyme